MLPIQSIGRNTLLIALGTAALVAAPAHGQVSLSEKRKDFIAFTPGAAGVALGAWIAPATAQNGRLHGGLMDGHGGYLLEIDGVLVENHYIVETVPSGTAYGAVYANFGFIRAPVAYFLGVWREEVPGLGDFWATLYRSLTMVGQGGELAGVMAGNFILEGGPGIDFFGLDGVDGIGLDEVDDLPNEIGILDDRWAGGPPVDLSCLMYDALVDLRDDFDAAGMGELEQDPWAGGPPIRILTQIQVDQIVDLVELQSVGFYKKPTQQVIDAGDADSIVPHKKQTHQDVGDLDEVDSIGPQKKLTHDGASDAGDADAIVPGLKEKPRVGTFRLRWKMFE